MPEANEQNTNNVIEKEIKISKEAKKKKSKSPTKKVAKKKTVPKTLKEAKKIKVVKVVPKKFEEEVDIKKEDKVLPPIITPEIAVEPVIKLEKALHNKEYLSEAKEELRKKIDALGSGISVASNTSNDKTINEKNMPVYINQEITKPSKENWQKEIEDEDGRQKKIKSKHSLKLYRNIAFLFIFATLCLAVVIFYFTFVKVTISLIPNQENISNNMVFDVYQQQEGVETGGSGLVGAVERLSIKLEKICTTTGAEIIGKEAVGEAIIKNTYEKNQPLVATTRLLSADGKLFRIKNTVNVPAGGSIKVEIYADQPSEEMAIGPTRFTIPGLWAGLQEQIYAETESPIIYQQKVKKSVTSEDLDNCTRDIKQDILNQAKEEVSSKYENFNKQIYNIDENSISSQVEAKVGEEKESFTVNMNADVVVVAFNEEKAKALARQKFILSLPETKELMTFDENNINYALNNYNIDQGVATVNATFNGKITLKDGANIVDVDKIIGLNEDQLDTYLDSLPDIAGHEIKFTPSFIWKVPKYIEPTKIKIEIKR